MRQADLGAEGVLAARARRLADVYGRIEAGGVPAVVAACVDAETDHVATLNVDLQVERRALSVAVVDHGREELVRTLADARAHAISATGILVEDTPGDGHRGVDRAGPLENRLAAEVGMHAAGADLAQRLPALPALMGGVVVIGR